MLPSTMAPKRPASPGAGNTGRPRRQCRSTIDYSIFFDPQRQSSDNDTSEEEGKEEELLDEEGHEEEGNEEANGHEDNNEEGVEASPFVGHSW